MSSQGSEKGKGKGKKGKGPTTHKKGIGLADFQVIFHLLNVEDIVWKDRNCLERFRHRLENLRQVEQII